MYEFDKGAIFIEKPKLLILVEAIFSLVKDVYYMSVPCIQIYYQQI